MQNTNKTKYRKTLIGLQIILVTILLIADWITLPFSVDLFYIKRISTHWVRVLIYIPIILIIQIEILGVSKLKTISSLYYLTLLILQLYITISLLFITSYSSIGLSRILTHILITIILLAINYFKIKSQLTKQ